MKVSVTVAPLASVEADALVVGLYAEEPRPRDAVARLDRAVGGQLTEVLTAERFQAKPGHVTYVHTGGRLPARRLVVVGLGKRAELSLETVRRAASAGLRRARELGARVVAIETLGERLPAAARAHAVTEGAILGSYTFDRYKREKTDKRVEELHVVEPDGRRRREATDGARTGEIFASATCFARDLVNSPANDVHPTFLAKVAGDIAREAKLGVKVLDRAECQKLGMGAFLGVAAGSEQPPKFIHLTYAPSGKRRRKVAIIGKGITFDSGGLDLKSAEGMLRMRLQPLRAPSIRSSARYGAGAAPWTASSRRARAFRSVSATALPGGLSTLSNLVPLSALFRMSSVTNASDSSTNSGGSSNRSAKPSSWARRPSSIRFWRNGFSTMKATAVSPPTSRGTSCVPPQPGMIPRKHSGQAKCRTAVEIVRASHCSASSTPPPRQAPLIAATVGKGRARMRPNSSWPVRLPSRASSGVARTENSSRSAPAEKKYGLPVITRPAQSPDSSSARRRRSDSNADRPNTVGFV